MEHADKIKRLVDITYVGISKPNLHKLRLKLFQATLADPVLQRHILAVAPTILERVVSASQDYSHISVDRPQEPTPPDVPEGKIRAVQTRVNPLDKLTAAIREFTQKLIDRPNAFQTFKSSDFSHQKGSVNERGPQPNPGRMAADLIIQQLEQSGSKFWALGCRHPGPQSHRRKALRWLVVSKGWK